MIKNKCCVCGKELKNDKETYIYFDSSNIAITRSMSDKYFCKECLERYEKYEQKGKKNGKPKN